MSASGKNDKPETGGRKSLSPGSTGGALPNSNPTQLPQRFIAKDEWSG
jgi:hypothetical protein